jgi:hypothetical protein
MDRDKALTMVKTWVPGPNALAQSPNEGGKVAGFGMGFLHGSIAPITFVLSLFKPEVGIYEVHNNGKAYNVGYLLGLMISLGGSAAGQRRSMGHARSGAPRPKLFQIEHKS